MFHLFDQLLNLRVSLLGVDFHKSFYLPLLVETVLSLVLKMKQLQNGWMIREALQLTCEVLLPRICTSVVVLACRFTQLKHASYQFLCNVEIALQSHVANQELVSKLWSYLPSVAARLDTVERHIRNTRAARLRRTMLLSVYNGHY